MNSDRISSNIQEFEEKHAASATMGTFFYYHAQMGQKRQKTTVLFKVGKAIDLYANRSFCPHADMTKMFWSAQIFWGSCADQSVLKITFLL